MKLLKHLDAPIRFLSFSMNDLILFSIPIFTGGLVDSMFIVPVTGIVTLLLMKKILKKFPKFYAIRFLYWSFPTGKFNRMLRIKMPPSHIRFWVK